MTTTIGRREATRRAQDLLIVYHLDDGRLACMPHDATAAAH
ncbi:MAG: hypothetical protein WA210_10825 [Burkholderiaceae bacterium]